MYEVNTGSDCLRLPPPKILISLVNKSPQSSWGAYLSSPVEGSGNKQSSVNDCELVMHVGLGMVKLLKM